MSPSTHDQALTRLRSAVDDGHLELGEYDRRSAELVHCKTSAQVAALVDDLPPDPRERDAAELREYVGEWRWWLAGVLVLTAVWGVNSLVDGELDRFWPAIPLGIWAAVLLALPLLPRKQD